MLIEVILVSLLSLIILITKQKKMKLSDLNIDIKGYEILIITALVEIAAQFLYKRFTGNNLLKFLSYYWIIYPAIFYVALRNLKYNFMKFFFLGTLLNFIAIIFNDFKMPVYISATLTNADKNILFLNTGQDLVHSLLTDSTNFKILCDIITIPHPYPFIKTISIGDILLLLGIFFFWQEAFRRTRA